MKKLKYNKGGWCPYGKAQFCQEGYCDSCEIYRLWKEKHDVIKVI
jgi:hypothetical protein